MAEKEVDQHLDEDNYVQSIEFISNVHQVCSFELDEHVEQFSNDQERDEDSQSVCYSYQFLFHEAIYENQIYSEENQVILDPLNVHDFTSLELTYSEFFKIQDGILVEVHEGAFSDFSQICEIVTLSEFIQEYTRHVLVIGEHIPTFGFENDQLNENFHDT